MTPIIDADGHIVEPRALWQEYTESAFRDRIPQIVADSEGIDRVKVEGELFSRGVITPAAMCIPGGLSEAQQARTLSVLHRPQRSAARGRGLPRLQQLDGRLLSTVS